MKDDSIWILIAGALMIIYGRFIMPLEYSENLGFNLFISVLIAIGFWSVFFIIWEISK